MPEKSGTRIGVPICACVPAEILVQIISSTEYNDQTWSSLRQSSALIKGLMLSYEHSITKDVAAITDPYARKDFPFFTTLLDQDDNRVTNLTYSFLSQVLMRRRYIRSILGEYVMIPTHYTGTEYILKGALHLLYAITDHDGDDAYETRSAQIEYVRSLSLHALAVLYYGIYVCVTELGRQTAPRTLINKHQLASPPERQQIELAFMELVLNRGPEWLADLIDGDPHAARHLHFEYEHMMNDIELRDASGPGPLPTLHNVVVNAIADKVPCRVPEVLQSVFRVVNQTPSLVNLSEQKLQDLLLPE